MVEKGYTTFEDIYQKRDTNVIKMVQAIQKLDK